MSLPSEFQLIDPSTRQLRSPIQQILADGKMILQERVKLEFHQSMVELGTEAEMAHIERIMREGTGTDRQLLVWDVRKMKAVVDHIVAETYDGLSLNAR